MSCIEAALKNIYFREDRCSRKCRGTPEKTDVMDHCFERSYCLEFKKYTPTTRRTIPNTTLQYQAAMRCKECIDKYGESLL